MVVTVCKHVSYLTFSISVFHPHSASERSSYHSLNWSHYLSISLIIIITIIIIIIIIIIGGPR